jgi:poly-gamma-glutamate system protein
MFRPVIQKTRTLVFMAIINLSLVFWVFNSTVVEKSINYEEKIIASKTMNKALKALKSYTIESNMQVFKSIDPNLTGLIFKEESLIRSSNGNLEDKQATLKPNFAGFMVDRLMEAGVERGDTVAVCLTGSNPGANIALFSAVNSLDVYPVIITSVSSSTWGATDPNFTWLDMESVLIEKGIFNYQSTLSSLGGKGDCLKRIGNFGGTESRNLIKSSIKRNNVDFIPYFVERDSSNLLRSIEYRLNEFESYIALNRYSAFINIGGGVSSIGIGGVSKLKNKSVFSPNEINKKELNPSVVKSFAEKDVPIVSIIKVGKIIDGILPPGSAKKKIGDGGIYFTEKYNLIIAWISTIISLSMILGIGLYSHKQVSDRLKSFNPDSTI